MANIKLLKEQRNTLIAEAEAMLETAQTEIRGLNEEETTAYESKLAEVNKINKTIELIEEKRSMVEEPKKEVENMEKRNYQEEVRVLTTQSGVNVIPTGLANDIVKKLEEKSAVVGECKKITYTGDYEVLQEGSSLVADVVGETESVAAKDISAFNKVVLKDKRISVLTLVSETVLNNSPVVGIDYLSDKVAQAVANKLEHEAFIADGTDKHLTQGLIVGGKEINGETTLEMMMETLTDMNPIFLNGAKWYVNRETYKVLAKMMNANKQPYMALEVAGQIPVYKFLGVPVVITDSVDCIVLANVGQALTMKLSENSRVKVLHEKYIESGQIGFLCDFYGDLAVTNPEAVRVLKPVV